MASSFAKRQAAAQSLGYSGYAEQRKARASGRGLRGSDRPGGTGRSSRPGGATAPPRSSGGGSGRSVFAKRQEAAQRAGYSGYAEQRKARASGRGLKGPDVADARKIAERRRIFKVGDRELIRLTKNNRGEAEVRGRVKGPDQKITITWEAAGRGSGPPIRMTRETTWEELSGYDDFEGYAEGETGDAYTSGSWSGAIGAIQVTLG